MKSNNNVVCILKRLHKPLNPNSDSINKKMPPVSH